MGYVEPSAEAEDGQKRAAIRAGPGHAYTSSGCVVRTDSYSSSPQ